MKQNVVYLQNLVQHVSEMSSYFQFYERNSLMLCTAEMCFHKPFVTFHKQ